VLHAIVRTPLADDLLIAQVKRVLRDIDSDPVLTPVTQPKLCRHTIDMAVATLYGEWLNLIVRVHTRRRTELQGMQRGLARGKVRPHSQRAALAQREPALHRLRVELSERKLP
jgi:hypothetical protein